MSQTSESNNKRIAKNTLLLYFRMLLIMVVTLFTSRVVLDKLGVTDYGICNALGGYGFERIEAELTGMRNIPIRMADS